MNRTKQIKDIAVIGMMIATLEVGKQALLFLPNVEIVTLLMILYTLTFGKRIFAAIPVFIFVEGCLYTFEVWVIMYLYIWPLLAFFVLCFQKQTSVWFFSILSGVFGLFFGALCSIPYFFIGGPAMGFAWWISGIPYDLIHGVSNFLLCLVLFRPLRAVLTKAKNQLY